MLAAIIAVLSVPSQSLAQCAFNAPTSAKGIKTSMVRAYAVCPGITFASPNTSTMAGVPGCTPPFALSEYSFDDEKGACSVRIKSQYAEPCPNGSSEPCMTSTLKAKCVGVLSPGGLLTNAPGFGLQMVTRRTVNDPSSGDLTVLDFPSQIGFSQAHNGVFTATVDPFEEGCAILECQPPPGCSSIQIVTITIYDPDGNIFAVAGSGSR